MSDLLLLCHSYSPCFRATQALFGKEQEAERLTKDLDGKQQALDAALAELESVKGKLADAQEAVCFQNYINNLR